VSTDANSSVAERLGGFARDRASWVELAKFALVGGSGYLINLAVFAVLAGDLGVQHTLAAILAFCCAVTSNYALNRRWTFGPGGGQARFEAARFFAVSIASLGLNLGLLEALLRAELVGELPAQAIAVAAAMPFNFLGNKLWTFAR
jgi:dolichol-phosphate mannosyltransferase